MLRLGGATGGKLRQFETAGLDFGQLQSVRRVGVDELPVMSMKCRIRHSRLLGKPREVDPASQCRRDASVLVA